MGQQRIYDPASGRGVTLEEAQAIIAQPPPSSGGGFAGRFGVDGDASAQNVSPSGPTQMGDRAPMTLFASPGGTDDVALDLPPMPREQAEAVIAMVPQIAGLLATMDPRLRGFKAAMLIPAVTRGVIDFAKTGQLDPNKMVEDAVLGAAGHGVGAVGAQAAKTGTNVVRRSLGLSGEYLNEVAEKTLPRAAIRENAKMTPEGVQALRDKFDATGAAVYDDLANVLQQAGLKSRNSPNISGGGITSIVADKLLPPETQLEIGKFMARPGGLVGSDTIGRSGELSFRSLMAYLQSQLPGNRSLEPQGPQRRPLVAPQ